MVAVGPIARPEVLIADDDAISRELLQFYLESVGCGVLAVSSGSEALEAYEATPGRIGLVILDACMPGPSPRHLCQVFHRLNPTVPVLFCSSFASDDPMLRFISERGLRLLRKPFDRPALFRAVSEVLRTAMTEISAAIVPCVEPDDKGHLPAIGADVLIADDESVHRRILEFYLGSFGCRVYSANNGHEVLTACREGAEGIRLVVLDIRMPGPSPIRLYQQIREVRPELPVLFCSGAPPDDPEICCVSEHGLQLLSKPFRRSQLQQAIKAALKR